MNDRPLVTVVIPTWNRRPFIAEAVGSVIAQTYQHWELIVVDDGSTDGTAEWLRTLEDPRVRVLSLAHTGHIGQLRNRGAAAGTGEFIAFLDSDDAWLPQKLEAQVKALRDSGAGWSYSRFGLMDAHGHTIPLAPDKLRLLSGNIIREMLTFSLSVCTPTIVVRRDLFEAAGGFSEDRRVAVGEDYELYLRIAARAQAIAVPEILARIREHSGRTTRGHADSYAIAALICELFLASNPEPSHARLARRVWTRKLADGGAKCLSTGEFTRAARLFGRSARHGANAIDWARALARGVRDGLLRRHTSGNGGIRPSSDG